MNAKRTAPPAGGAARKSRNAAATAPDAAPAPRRRAAAPRGERHHREAPEVRRKSIIQAAMRSIAKFGFAGTTIGNICAEAQV